MIETTNTVPDYPRGITFEQVWAALMEDREQLKKQREEFDRRMEEQREENTRLMEERRKENDRLMEERRKENDRLMEERQKENARLMEERQKENARLMDERRKENDLRLEEIKLIIKENNKLIGGLGNSIGGIIETLVAARLWEKFQGYPYGFTRVFRRMPIYKPGSTRPLTEIDILLSDTEWAMAVEVKRDMVIKDVEHHIERMKRIKENLPAEAVGKKFLAAFACGTVTDEARDAAFASGFFVLELKGESVELLPPPRDFNPKEW